MCPITKIYIYLVKSLIAGAVTVSLLSILTCHALLLFTLGVLATVFWILTCLQCPVPCHHYRGGYRGVL